MSDYEKSLGHWIKRFYLLTTQAMESELTKYGLGRTQWYILYHIAEVGTLAQRELQTILNVESATLTPLVAALVKKGWVIQYPSVSDRRSKVLELTKEGVSHFSSIPNPIINIRSKAMAGLDTVQIENARKVIEQAVKNLEK
ncbi:hypothetical protein TW81_06580 [Vibrio galatheae]|uniref:HTH marR-type domain-containing protein n=1 Tax=Vibrio galatheae TaxID=579748 RepID=A0A0F4NLC8_9VIBR|nr:MarR family transcriptional regulator [Vibrio galatheae]KJY83985.1 hypothetical protein TW81_06580 [Vibrio galatheae]